MNTTEFETFGAAMAEIDPADTIAALEANAQRTAEIEAASERANAQLVDLAEKAQEARRNGPDHRAAADALLTGEDVCAAANGLDDLEKRSEALRQGIRGLRERADDLRASRKRIEQELADRFAAAGDLLFPGFLAEAQGVAEQLAQIYANVRTAGAATGSGKLVYLAERLSGPLARLSRQDINEQALIGGASLRPNPVLASALSLGTEALTVARRPIPEGIPLPDDMPDGGAFRAGLLIGAELAGTNT